MLPRRAFDDGAAGLEQALLLGLVDHGDADAIFYGAAGVDVVGLDVDLRLQSLVDAIEADQWRASDGFEDVVTFHVRSYPLCVPDAVMCSTRDAVAHGYRERARRATIHPV